MGKKILRKLKLTTNRLRTLAWLFKHPAYWDHALSVVKRQFLLDHDTAVHREKAREWAGHHASSYADALKKIGIEGTAKGLHESVIKDGETRAAQAPVKMGGAGGVDLLYDLVRLTRASKVIESGVAYGWSSLAILHAFSMNGNGQLFSVDMPYPGRRNEKFVGIVVPDRYRKNWTLVREPDRRGLKKAIYASGGEVDLCHYDSDKSWWGRAYGFPLMWDALRLGGVFVSDDIGDNLFFSEFVAEKGFPFAVIEYQSKFIGIIRKL